MSALSLPYPALAVQASSPPLSPNTEQPPASAGGCSVPIEIPLVKEKLSTMEEDHIEEDYFTNLEKRKEIFERDKWMCFYCGEKVTKEDATLDHFIPQFKGGKNTKENLKTACFICNSIKAGRTYEEAAPYLLKSIQERRAKEEI